MSTTRLTLRERAWLPLEYIRTVGPLTDVTAEKVRAALIGLHAADPTHRAVSRLNRSRARWEHLDAAAFAGYVREAVTEGPADPDKLSRELLAEPRGHHPVRIVVGGGYLAMKVAHAYGDAGPVNTLLRELVRAAGDGRPARIEPSPRQRFALARAWWNQFVKHPKRLREGVRLGGTYAPADTDVRAWKADLTVRTARSAEVLGKMRTWRDDNAPGVTTSAITFAAFVAALQRVGLDPDTSGGIFLADARRYLPKETRIDSNFCWGQFLEPADLTDPTSIHRTLKAELGTGRMLTMMMLREGKLALLGGAGMPAPYPDQAPVRVHPRLTFSNQGRHDLLADLPWAVNAAGRVNHSIPTLNGPEGVTITTSEMGGVLHVEVLFHASTFDATLMTQALELVCTDPAALFTAAKEDA